MTDEGGGDWGGPYVTAAFFCAVVHAREGAPPTFEGVTDGASALPSAGGFRRPTFVVMLTGGTRRDRMWLEVVGHAPHGSTWNVLAPRALVFDGPGFGHTVAARLRLSTAQEGTFWFDVVVDGRLLTRSPYRVEHRH